VERRRAAKTAPLLLTRRAASNEPGDIEVSSSMAVCPWRHIRHRARWPDSSRQPRLKDNQRGRG
jgi:hypothetical protein